MKASVLEFFGRILRVKLIASNESDFYLPMDLTAKGIL